MCAPQLVIDLGGIHASENARYDLTPLNLGAGTTFTMVRCAGVSIYLHGSYSDCITTTISNIDPAMRAILAHLGCDDERIIAAEPACLTHLSITLAANVCGEPALRRRLVAGRPTVHAARSLRRGAIRDRRQPAGADSHPVSVADGLAKPAAFPQYPSAAIAAASCDPEAAAVPFAAAAGPAAGAQAPAAFYAQPPLASSQPAAAAAAASPPTSSVTVSCQPASPEPASSFTVAVLVPASCCDAAACCGIPAAVAAHAVPAAAADAARVAAARKLASSSVAWPTTVAGFRRTPAGLS